MARVKGKIQYPKKVDIRMTNEFNDELEFIVHITGAKRSSWIRGAIEDRISLYKLENRYTWEEEYEQFKQKLTTRELQEKIVLIMLKRNPKATVGEVARSYQSLKKYLTGE